MSDQEFPPLEQPCSTCGGENNLETFHCQTCNGHGVVPTPFGRGVLHLVARWIKIPAPARNSSSSRISSP